MNLFWRPREGLVYKSWTKGDAHVWKAAEVRIEMDGRFYDGTFMLKGEKCTLHLWHKGRKPTVLNLPRKKVKIKKKESVIGGEPQGYTISGKRITYDVLVDVND